MPVQEWRQPQDRIDPDRPPSANLCGKTILDRSARLSGYAVREVANVKNNKYRGTVPPIFYRLLPLAISQCDELGPNAQSLISALAEAKVDKFGCAEDEEGQKAAVTERGGEYSAVVALLSQPSAIVSH